MSYRTLKNPGDKPGAPLPPKPGQFGQGKPQFAQIKMRGLKITTNADIAINTKLMPQQATEARALFDKIRDGSAPTNNGVYQINGYQCNHVKFDGQAHALAWRAPANDEYAYIEAVIAKTGAGNAYAEV